MAAVEEAPAQVTINDVTAIPGLEEMIYASVEKALAVLLPPSRRRHHRGSRSKSRSKSKSRSESRSRSRGGRSRSGSRGKHDKKCHEHHGGKMRLHKGPKGHHLPHHFKHHHQHPLHHGEHHSMSEEGGRRKFGGGKRGHGGRRGHGRRFHFLACGARMTEPQVGAERGDEPVEIIDLEQEKAGPSTEGELQKGFENMNVGDKESAFVPL
ncbi:hypothetical protein JTB14_012992 [Gonioctena quinquepunctata]|nr:hypothetical protein JTB14_012992 [Gonioctena quinquepunctata]